MKLAPCLPLFLAAAIVTPNACAGDRPIHTDSTLAGLFVQELFRNGNTALANAEECISKTRPLTVMQEFTDIFTMAVKDSVNIKVTAACKALEGKTLSDCTLYFSSSHNRYQWSAGFHFLGNPGSGKIDPRTITCFST